MELELQTHCKPSVTIRSKQGTILQSYNSVPTTAVADPQAEDAMDVQAPAAPETPKKPGHPVIKKSATRVQEQTCQVCKRSDDVSFWLGCGGKDKKTKRECDTYWVHQNCIGLYYRKEAELQSVKFYCPKHKPKY